MSRPGADRLRGKTIGNRHHKLGDSSPVHQQLTAAGLAKWKLPEQIVLWDTDLPRTASGKIIRQQLVDGNDSRRCLYAPRIEVR